MTRALATFLILKDDLREQNAVQLLPETVTSALFVLFPRVSTPNRTTIHGLTLYEILWPTVRSNLGCHVDW